MEPEKLNFLAVSYEKNRGLKLRWDFKDFTTREKYFRHIFVLSCEISGETLSIL
jgi:hypothetical protein